MASLLNEAMLADSKQKGFAGKFYPQELINSGGMSEIWLVTDGRGKPFALRKLKKELRFNLLARRRFLRGCEVLITRNGGVQLIDFDLAQPIPEKPIKMSKNPGTPGYMAPEQLQREPIDARVDVFAYGVAAYEILTNLKPFPGETPAEILAAQLNPAGPVPPREHNPGIPFALEKAILKCIAREPDRRYPFMSILKHDVENALYV
jgi:hypothetical protein